MGTIPWIVYGNGIVDNISGSEGRGQFLVEFHAQSQVKPGKIKPASGVGFTCPSSPGGKKIYGSPSGITPGISLRGFRIGIESFIKGLEPIPTCWEIRNIQLIIKAEERSSGLSASLPKTMK